MKHILKSGLNLIIFAVALFFLSGCYETHYYSRYHHHTRPWYERHHQPPPPGVDFRVDIR